ncbi:MAG: virulence-associated protein VapB [Pseudomonadota bacterium]|nr:virulence-associated protein VapB [Pseudomonadota bacterium]
MDAVSNLPPSAAPARRVRFFRNGANQAVRIPREFELPGEEATVRREGNALIIESVEPEYPKGSVAAVQQALRKLQALGPIDEEFPDVDEGLLPLDDIEL